MLLVVMFDLLKLEDSVMNISRDHLKCNFIESFVIWMMQVTDELSSQNNECFFFFLFFQEIYDW